jgi:SHAQKYF class myb-like DNA-binding protein
MNPPCDEGKQKMKAEDNAKPKEVEVSQMFPPNPVIPSTQQQVVKSSDQVTSEKDKISGKRSQNESEVKVGSNPKIKQPGRWMDDEHERFITGNILLLNIAIKLYGKKWRKVEEYVGTRTGIQIRSHAQKYFNKLNKLQNEQKKERKLPNVSSDKIESISESELKNKLESNVRKKVEEENKNTPIEEVKGQSLNEAHIKDINTVPKVIVKESEIREINIVNEKVNEKVNESLKQEETVLMLTDKELKRELLRHEETVSSFKRVFAELKLSYESDPLIDVELDQGRKILSVLLNKIKEQFAAERETKELYPHKDKLIKDIGKIQNMITDIVLKIGNERSFKQFFDTKYTSL